MGINLPEDQLEELGVAIVYLFGSQAEGLAGKLSDIDVAVVLLPEKMPRDTRELYGKLYDIFTDVFDMSNFKNIDIVFLEKANLELQFDVIRHGKVLYSTSENFKEEFEHRVAMLYMDFKPLLKDFNKQILHRI